MGGGLSLLAAIPAQGAVSDIPGITHGTTGKIHIQKLPAAKPPTGDVGDGTAITPGFTNGIVGAKFRACPITDTLEPTRPVIDTGVPANHAGNVAWYNWAETKIASGLADPATFGPSYSGCTAEVTTGSNGLTSLTVDYGLWEVWETTAPDGYLASSGPFFAVVPYLNSMGLWVDDGTDYSIYVYPKNADIVAEKTAVITSAGKIGYTLKTEIPYVVDALGDPLDMESFTFEDKLTGGTYVENSIVITVGPSIAPAVSAQILSDLVPDYTVTFREDVLENDEMLIDSEEDGIDIINQYPAFTPVTVYYEVEPDGVYDAVSNDFKVTWNESGGDTVKLPLGGVTITKVDEGDEAITSDFATFRVWANSTKTGSPVTFVDGAGVTVTSVNTSSGGSGTGQAVITGLPYSDGTPKAGTPNCWYDGTTIYHTVQTLMAPGTSYWLEETHVPKGYRTTGNLVEVCVTSYPAADNSHFNVENIQGNFLNIQLPFTGELGKDLPVMFGLALVLGSLTVYAVRTKKANAAKAI